MIRGLGDFKKKDDDEKKKTTSYTGGEKSGLAVENPSDDLVRKAMQGGKEHAASGKGGAPSTELKITLYANGFTIDNGQFRPYDQKENQQFMKELNEGYVPKEIQNKFKGPVNVALEDKRQEDYRPPTPPKYVAYSGSGQSIGGVQGVGLQVNKSAGGLPVVDQSKPKTNI
jgi:UBX domain-containing protein 1